MGGRGVPEEVRSGNLTLCCLHMPAYTCLLAPTYLRHEQAGLRRVLKSTFCAHVAPQRQSSLASGGPQNPISEIILNPNAIAIWPQEGLQNPISELILVPKHREKWPKGGLENPMLELKQHQSISVDIS